MGSLFKFFQKKGEPEEKDGYMTGPEHPLDREIDALYSMLADILGSDKLVIKAGKMDAMRFMRSPLRGERILALQRIILENPTIEHIPSDAEIPKLLTELSERIADLMARRSLEDKIEKKIAEKLEENHEDYVKDIRMQILDEENPEKESPQAKERREALEKLEGVKLTQSVMELLRPKTLDEIVGQPRAVRSLLAKLSSPYPQHLILYGPPGIGKTTAARLVLEQAKHVDSSPFAEDAPFVETDGTTLRWDPRDMTNPLIGSVHDPIYQGARRDLADIGVPEPKPGLVTDAHGGVLFIDEIGEMDVMLQNKLLKVLEDKRAFFESTYYDPTDPKVPPYIKKLFDEGAPADFVLIGATTREARDISPALRSRCAEIYFEPLTPAHIVRIVENAAKKLDAALADGVAALISDYTVEGRKAINILADAYSFALERREGGAPVVIGKDDIYEVAQVSRLYQYIKDKSSERPEIGHVFGLGVSGYLGSVIEIEAVAFPAHEKGKATVRFNETAGSMAKDSVFNAASVVRRMTGLELSDYDLHINVVGGGNIDGPSAGTAILAAITSALTKRPIRQDVAVTGEISLYGRVRPVGGVFEKAYGAKQAGMKSIIIPMENDKDIPEAHLGLSVHPVETAEEAFKILFADGWTEGGATDADNGTNSAAEY